MASTFPSTLTTFTDPQPTDRLNSPSHSSIEGLQNSALQQIEATIGTVSSVAGTLMYDVRAAASGGGGHVQSANKGGTGQTSYAKGDLLVASSSSVLAKLAIGSVTQVLTVDSTQSTGLKWADPSLNVSMIPKPEITTFDVASSLMSGATTGFVSKFTIPSRIVVNKVSWNISGVATSGQFKFGMFSEDGQTQLFSIAMPTASSVGIYSASVASVSVPVGKAYVVLVPVSTANIAPNSYVTDTGNAIQLLNNNISGEPLYEGTITVASGTMPTTFNPSSMVASSDLSPLFRLDN